MKRTKTYEKPTIFLFGALIGVLFFLIVYGTAILHPTYDAWLMNQDTDLPQHYLGWRFYRQSDWTFPIGMLDGMNSDGPVSVIYADAIPLFALLFKLLSPILPATFQYFGIWILLCYFLQGGLSALLLYHLKPSVLFAGIGAIFYIASPQVADRIYHHDALMAQWLILFAMLSCVNLRKEWRHKYTPILLWTANSVLAVLVHLYFLPMVYLFMLGYCIADIGQTRKVFRSLLIFLTSTLASLVTMWIFGAFQGGGELAGTGLGKFSANLNALFNPMGKSTFLKKLPMLEGQGEGFGYLGLGMLLLCFLAFAVLLCRQEKRRFLRHYLTAHKWEVIACVVVVLLCLFLAVSPKCTFGKAVIYHIPYPAPIKTLLATFRASGRFIWVIDNILFTLVLYVFSKLQCTKTAICVLLLCLIIQLVDCRPLFRAKGNQNRTKITIETPLQDDRWDDLAKGTTEIIFAPLPENFCNFRWVYYTFADYALTYHMNLSSFYFARHDYAALSAYAEDAYTALLQGNGRADAIYVFLRPEDVPKRNDYLEIYHMDGFTVTKTK